MTSTPFLVFLALLFAAAAVVAVRRVRERRRPTDHCGIAQTDAADDAYLAEMARRAGRG